MIEYSNVNVSFGTFHVLKDVNFHVEKGDFFNTGKVPYKKDGILIEHSCSFLNND